MRSNSRLARWRNLLIVAVLIAYILPTSGTAQMKESSVRNDGSGSPSAVDEYKIGADDLLVISVADAPEFGGKFRVTDSGMIELAGIPTPIRAEGKTAIELSHVIREALIAAKQLREPKVNVFIEEYRGRTVTVLGAVSKPAVYSLQKETNVLEALSMAGGALPGAGNTVTIVRGAASAESSGTEVGSVKIIDMSRLVKGEDLTANVEVKNGDVLSVSAAQVVYVVGAVVKPGGFTMPSPESGISAIQAIALAEGFSSVAATNRALIIRQSTSGIARREIAVDLAAMQAGKETDVLLAPNDILYIPESKAKKTLKVMGEVAMAAANGAAIYGVGYRVGNVK